MIALMLRSIRSGNATTLIMKATSANRNPTPLPIRMTRWPAGVSKICRRNSSIEAGGGA